MEAADRPQPSPTLQPPGAPGPVEAARAFFFLRKERVHETFQVLSDNLFMHEIRYLIENTGTETAYFVLGPLHRKFTQVDLQAYDRDQLCEFIPSYREVDYVTAYVTFQVLTEVRQSLRTQLAGLGQSGESLEELISRTVEPVQEDISNRIAGLVAGDPEGGAEVRTGLYAVELLPSTTEGSGLGRWTLGDLLLEAKRLVDIVSEWYFEVLQLRDGIPPGGYRLVAIRSREPMGRSRKTSGHRNPLDTVVELPFEPILNRGQQQPSLHLRFLPPEGLDFRSSNARWKRYILAAFQVRWALVALCIPIFLALVLPVYLLLIPITLALSVISLNSLYLGRHCYFERISWTSRAGGDQGFQSWRTEFSISSSSEQLMNLDNLAIAHQDRGLIYLVFLSAGTGVDVVETSEYAVRVAFSLPRLFDRAPSVLSVFVWAVIYISAIAYLLGGESLPGSILSLYYSELRDNFPSVIDFLKSLMLPMTAIGVSTSFASLILYIDRTVAQRRLLRGLMALVLVLTAGAVLLPVILVSLSLI